MVLPMNTGAEAVETGIKLARKWGYKEKGIPKNEAIVLAVTENFHGRTVWNLFHSFFIKSSNSQQFAAISLSTDPESRDNYGPYLPNIGSEIPGTDRHIRYNHVEDLEEVLNKCGKKVCGFIVEPIQGEAGIVVPDDDYLSRVHALCKKHNVLLICDEVQTGQSRLWYPHLVDLYAHYISQELQELESFSVPSILASVRISYLSAKPFQVECIQCLLFWRTRRLCSVLSRGHMARPMEATLWVVLSPLLLSR